MDDRLADYIDVAERITLFYERFPDGRLQCDFRIEELDGATFLVATAYAYTTPEDPRPGLGTAQELIPGRTAFTRGSEYQNAETSAWGRAIASLGIATKRGIATKQEVAGAKQRRFELGNPKKIEVVSHSDQLIPEEDPWMTPIDPETGESASIRPAEALVESALGGVILEPEWPSRFEDMHAGEPSEKQLSWVKSLVDQGANQLGTSDLEYLNAVLSDIGYLQVTSWDALGRKACSRVIDKLREKK